MTASDLNQSFCLELDKQHRIKTLINLRFLPQNPHKRKKKEMQPEGGEGAARMTPRPLRFMPMMLSQPMQTASAGLRGIRAPKQSPSAGLIIGSPIDRHSSAARQDGWRRKGQASGTHCPQHSRTPMNQQVPPPPQKKASGRSSLHGAKNPESLEDTVQHQLGCPLGG